jgi:uncharacterized membrane protein
MTAIIRFIHLLSLVVWIGGMIFFSFIAAPSIFKVLPRNKAGEVVGDIFPKYWIMGYICSAMALLTILILSLHNKLYIFLLIMMCVLTFYSGLAVGTRARAVKARIRLPGDPNDAERLKTEFNRLHRRSMILNGIIMILGIIAILFFTLDTVPT